MCVIFKRRRKTKKIGLVCAECVRKRCSFLSSFFGFFFIFTQLNVLCCCLILSFFLVVIAVAVVGIGLVCCSVALQTSWIAVESHERTRTLTHSPIVALGCRGRCLFFSFFFYSLICGMRRAVCLLVRPAIAGVVILEFTRLLFFFSRVCKPVQRQAIKDFILIYAFSLTHARTHTLATFLLQIILYCFKMTAIAAALTTRAPCSISCLRAFPLSFRVRNALIGFANFTRNR